MSEEKRPATSFKSGNKKNIASVAIILVVIAVVGIALGKFLGKKLTLMGKETTATTEAPTTAAPEPTSSVGANTPDVPKYPTGLYTVATESSNLNLRSGPGSEFPTINSIPKGTVLTVAEVQGEWGRVDYNTTIGWVNMKYMKSATSAETTTETATSAAQTTQSTEATSNS